MKIIKLILTGLILGAFFLLSYTAIAYEVPKDAVIKVFTKNGKQIGSMTRQNYKVVKIEENKIKEDKTEKETTPQQKQVVIQEAASNEIIIHAGVGKHGLSTTRANGVFSVQADDSFIGGLTYCRGRLIGVCASAFTNKSLTLGVKLGW